MSKTKTKILAIALKLFNEKGIAQVSLRTISNEMGISPGNLTYHFKKREDIIETLYLELVSKLDVLLEFDGQEQSLLGMLFKQTDGVVQCFYDYRFILLDFVAIIRNHPPIRKHYRSLLQLREQQFEFTVKALLQAKLIRKELIENEYQYVYLSFRIIGDFWLSAEVIEKNSITKKRMKVFSKLLKMKIFPYLTEKGRREFKRLIEAN